MADVVLKGEFHSSEGDLEEEKQLVKSDFDTLVIEGQASESEYGWTEGWFNISVLAMFWLIGRIYVSKDILLDLAEVQSTEVVYTREANSDLLENTPLFMKLFSALTFYTLVPGSVIIGLKYGTTWGMTTLFSGFALPVLAIRFYNMNQSSEEKNRDKIMADKIIEAEGEDQSVLAIVGAGHVKGIEKHLPEDLDVEVRPPAYPRRAKEHIREVALPFFEVMLVLYSLYLLVSWGMIRAVQISAAF